MDDEPDLVDVIAELVSDQAFFVKTALCGSDALKIFKTEEVDAILSDISMSQMDGLQLLAEVRSTNSQVPFVILTAHGDSEHLHEAIRLGASDFLEKPFDPDHLKQVAFSAVELGLKQRQSDLDFELIVKSLSLKPDEAIRIRQARKSILGLRHLAKQKKKKAS